MASPQLPLEVIAHIMRLAAATINPSRILSLRKSCWRTAKEHSLLVQLGLVCKTWHRAALVLLDRRLIVGGCGFATISSCQGASIASRRHIQRIVAFLADFPRDRTLAITHLCVDLIPFRPSNEHARLALDLGLAAIIGRLPWLKSLAFPHGITSDGSDMPALWSALADLKAVKSVTFIEPTCDTDLSRVLDIFRETLEELNVYGTEIEPKTLCRIVDLPSLRSLSLIECGLKFTSADANRTAIAAPLTHLQFGAMEIAIDWDGRRFLNRILQSDVSLRVLDLQGHGAISFTKYVEGSRVRLDELEELRWMESQSKSQSQLLTFLEERKPPKLRRLVLGRTLKTYPQLMLLASLRACPALELIHLTSLDGEQGPGDQALRRFLGGLGITLAIGE